MGRRHRERQRKKEGERMREEYFLKVSRKSREAFEVLGV